MNRSTEITGLSLREALEQQLGSRPGLLWGGAYFAGGLFTAMGRLSGETAPFGVSFAAAAPPAYTLPALLGAALGYLIAAPMPLSWQYSLAALGAVLIRQVLAALWKKPRNWQAAAAASMAVAAAVVLPGLYREPLVYDVLLWVTALMMAGTAAVFLRRGLSLCTKEPSLRLQALREQSTVISLALVAALILMGLCSISLSGVMPGRVALSVLLLLTAAGAGSRSSAMLGVAGGMVAGFSTGDFTLSTTCFAVGGLLAGLFAPLGRLGSALALSICYGFFAMLASRSAAGWLEVILAAILFLMLPTAAPRRVGALISPHREGQAACRVMGERLEDASAALRDVAATTKEVAARLQEAAAGGIEAVYDRTAQRHCRGCLYQMSCWQQHYNDTVDALSHGIGSLRETGTLLPEQLGGSMEKCPRKERIAATLAAEYRAYTTREEERRRARRTREIVTDQFEGLAEALEGLSHSVRGVYPCGEAQARRIAEALSAEQRDLREILCWRDEGGHLTVRVRIPAALERWAEPAHLGHIIAAASGTPMGEAVRTREGAELLLTWRERPQYRLEQGQHQIAAGGGTVSGDTLRLVKCPGGDAALVLSDGMGTGINAALDSAMLCSLVCRLLEAGLPCCASLRLVNSALMVKGGRESLATLDAAAIDPYTGKTRFYKAGAAPTVLRHEGKGVTIESVSLPAGILDGVAAECRELNLVEGDLIVMMSDGVPTEGNWLPPLLEAWQGKDLNELCRRIAEGARLRRREENEDDITVAALRLVKCEG